MKKIGIFILCLLTIASLAGSVYVLYLYTEQQKQFATQTTQWEKQKIEYQASIDAQRKSKNDVRTEWEKQLVANDELVTAVVQLEDNINLFLKNPKQSESLTTSLILLESTLNKNTDLKLQTRDTVEKIYQRDGEDQANRANPDGIK